MGRGRDKRRGSRGNMAEEVLRRQSRLSAVATGSEHPPCLQAWLVQPGWSAQSWVPWRRSLTADNIQIAGLAMFEPNHPGAVQG